MSSRQMRCHRPGQAGDHTGAPTAPMRTAAPGVDWSHGGVSASTARQRIVVIDVAFDVA
jgi:hypothetical protein